MGSVHADKISQTKGLELTAIVDTNLERVETAQKKGYSAYQSTEEAFKKYQNFDVVVVTTNTKSHYQDLKNITDIYVKNKWSLPALFVEKPVVSNEKEAAELREIFLANGYPAKHAFMCGYLLRESPVVEKFLEILKKEED